MTGLGPILRRLGSPAAVSWPVFWASLLMNTFLVFTGSLDIGLTLWQQLALLAATQAAVMGFLWLCRLTVLRHAAQHPRPLLTLTCFVGAGLSRGVMAAVIHTWFLGPETTRLGTRLLAGIVAVVVFLVPTAIIVASWRDYRDRRSQLTMRQAQLAETADRLIADIAERDRAVIDRVRTELDRVLSGGDPGRRLQAWSRDVIRPLSHELASQIEVGAPGAVTPERVRASAVLDRATSGAPLLPITTAVAAVVIAFIAILLAFGWWLALGYSVLVFGSGAAMLWLANRLMVAISHWVVGLRALTMVVVLTLIGAAVGQLAHLFLPERDLTYSIMRGNAILFVAFGVGFAIARAVSQELRQTMADLEQADSQLIWRVARLRLLQWVQGARFARALHGPVQGSIAVAIEQLRERPQDQDRILARLRMSLLQVLDGDEVAATWADGVDRLQRSWQGVCEVDVTTRSACAQRLDGDPVCREMALEIVTEAVSNAVRHGGATQVSAAMSCEGDRTTLIVQDNGQEATSGAPGLGTRVLESCALEWSRDRIPGGAILRAVLPASTA